ncbi:MAG TPA: hypothetical protein PKJ63_01465 [Cyclobacteriaceae bacterium]|nr:hypothetical protein [Cyclobacteriaceae bacterium]
MSLEEDLHTTLEGSLPELDDQIRFVREVWERIRKGEKSEISKEDFLMIEAILGSLCACKYI